MQLLQRSALVLLWLQLILCVFHHFSLFSAELDDDAVDAPSAGTDTDAGPDTDDAVVALSAQAPADDAAAAVGLLAKPERQ